MMEPKICPNCGKQTIKVRSIFLCKTGMPELVERAVLRLYEQKKSHVYTSCINCAKNRELRLKGLEISWISVLGELWGWFWKENHYEWGISEFNREQVEFT